MLINATLEFCLGIRIPQNSDYFALCLNRVRLLTQTKVALVFLRCSAYKIKKVKNDL